MDNNWVNVDEYDGESLKATDMEIGESIIGTLTNVQESKKFEGTYFLHLVDDKGNKTRIFTAGNLTYKAKDGKLKPGYLVRITRDNDTPGTKGNKPRSTFTVEVDKESKLAADGSAAQ